MFGLRSARRAIDEISAAATETTEAAERLGAAAARLDPSSAELDAFLAHLALQQLVRQVNDMGSQAQLALSLIALDAAAAIADLSVRAGVSTSVLAVVPALNDHWWPPLLGLALSAVLLAVGAQGVSKLVGPDPEGVRPTLDAAVARRPEFTRLRLVTLLLIESYEENQIELERKHLGAWITAGILVALTTFVVTGVTYWGTGRWW